VRAKKKQCNEVVWWFMYVRALHAHTHARWRDLRERCRRPRRWRVVGHLHVQLSIAWQADALLIGAQHACGRQAGRGIDDVVGVRWGRRGKGPCTGERKALCDWASRRRGDEGARGGGGFELLRRGLGAAAVERAGKRDAGGRTTKMVRITCSMWRSASAKSS